MLGLSSSENVINPGDGVENLGIGMEVAAVTCGQDVPLFEMREGVFDNKILHLSGCLKILQRASLVLLA